MPLERWRNGVSTKSPTSAKSMMSSNLASTSSRSIPCSPPTMCRLSRTVRSALNPPEMLTSGATPPTKRTQPSSGIKVPATSLQQRALALPVRADDADRLALRDLERDVAQRPELALCAPFAGAPEVRESSVADSVAPELDAELMRLDGDGSRVGSVGVGSVCARRSLHQSSFRTRDSSRRNSRQPTRKQSAESTADRTNSATTLSVLSGNRTAWYVFKIPTSGFSA